MVIRLKGSGRFEKVVQGLTIFSFVLMCWLAHRALQPRPQCLHSTFLTFVQIDSKRLDNCSRESRLSIKPVIESDADLAIARTLEGLDSLSSVFPAGAPFLAVEVSSVDPYLFEIGRGYLRLGRAWLRDANQTNRAMLMALLKTKFPSQYANQFQLEVIADFLLMSVNGDSVWTDELTQKKYSTVQDIKFPTMAASFAEYCRSPFRSISHRMVCQMPEPEAGDLQVNVWGTRPLLSAALWRVYDKLPLSQRMRVQRGIREGRAWPVISGLRDDSVVGLILWFQRTLQDHVSAMGIEDTADSRMAIKQTMKELQVEAPTHWELTVDLKNTPAWKEVLTQLKEWSRLRKNQRTLVFTPQGTLALPAGLPVTWAAPDINSQKHVMIACHWPKPAQTLAVVARHFFAQQNCGKLTQAFWD